MTALQKFIKNQQLRAICFLILFFLPSTLYANNKVSTTYLENGLQVVVIPNHKAPVISHMLWYKIGAIHEPQGKSGLAHYLEHLMFKGTKKIPDGMFSKNISKAGGNDNAFTSYDFTCYFQNIPKDKLELAMSMEADRMKNVIFNEKSASLELDVVLEERRARVENQPSSKLSEQMRASLYLNHPYRKPLIGWFHEIDGLSVNDAQNFYQKYYSPNNAILVVSGDITLDKLLPLAKKYYGQIKPTKDLSLPSINKEPKPVVKRLVSLKDKNVNHPEWARYYISPSEKTAKTLNTHAITVLSHIFGGSEASILHKELVMKKLASKASSFYDPLESGPSYFGIYIIPSKKKYSKEKLEQSLGSLIEEIKLKGVNEADLERTKKYLIAEDIYAKEDLKTLAYAYGQALSIGLDINYVENWKDEIAKITNEDIKKAANIIFTENRSVTGLLEGEK